MTDIQQIGYLTGRSIKFLEHYYRVEPEFLEALSTIDADQAIQLNQTLAQVDYKNAIPHADKMISATEQIFAEKDFSYKVGLWPNYKRDDFELNKFAGIQDQPTPNKNFGEELEARRAKYLAYPIIENVLSEEAKGILKDHYKCTQPEIVFFSQIREPGAKFVDNLNEAVARGNGEIINHTLSDLYFHKVNLESEEKWTELLGSKETIVDIPLGLSEHDYHAECLDNKILATHPMPRTKEPEPRKAPLLANTNAPDTQGQPQRKAPMIDGAKVLETSNTANTQGMAR